jgi:hypothetical protein
MGSVAAPVLLALAVALVVLVVSAVVSAGRPVRELAVDGWHALRGGLRRDRWSAAPQGGDATAPHRATTPVGGRALGGAEPDEDEASVTDLFDIGRLDADAYVRADRLAAALERAQGAVVGSVQQVQQRVRR